MKSELEHVPCKSLYHSVLRHTLFCYIARNKRSNYFVRTSQNNLNILTKSRIFCCRNCSQVVYCSRACESESWIEYHRVECEFASWMRTLPPDGNSSNLGKIVQLALRISLKAGCDNLLRYFAIDGDKERKCPLQAGFTKGVYLNDYNSVFHMASNKKARSLNVRKDYAVLAAMTIQLLESSQLFTQLGKTLSTDQKSQQSETTNRQIRANKGEDTQQGPYHRREVRYDIEEIKSAYAASLVHHMQIIQCNAYGIVEREIPNTGFRIKGAVYSGLALYTTMGLINHCCDPVLDISFNGSTAIYRAYKNVKKGDQITVDYGPIYYLQKKDERQLHLKNNYYFDCECPPCKNNWPMWEDIKCKIPRLNCPSCEQAFPSDIAISSDVQCSNCKRHIDLLGFLRQLAESHKDYAAAMEEAKKGNSSEALPVLKRHLTLMQEVIRPPWKEFISCQAAIDQCYRMEDIFNCD